MTASGNFVVRIKQDNEGKMPNSAHKKMLNYYYSYYDS